MTLKVDKVLWVWNEMINVINDNIFILGWSIPLTRSFGWG